ncbi:TPA: hypothetical protein ACGJXQ_005453, partial [Pseudomonas aeruginosa]
FPSTCWSNDMERYHSTAGDPPRRDADVKRQEAQELDELVQQFLAGGGQIEKVGYKMRELQTLSSSTP